MPNDDTMNDYIALGPNDRWRLAVLARLSEKAIGDEQTRKAFERDYLERLSTDEIKDIGRVLLRQKAEAEVSENIRRTVESLRQWAKRNRRTTRRTAGG